MDATSEDIDRKIEDLMRVPYDDQAGIERVIMEIGELFNPSVVRDDFYPDRLRADRLDIARRAIEDRHNYRGCTLNPIKLITAKNMAREASQALLQKEWMMTPSLVL
jgi:hypothetical protein